MAKVADSRPVRPLLSSENLASIPKDITKDISMDPSKSTQDAAFSPEPLPPPSAQRDTAQHASEKVDEAQPEASQATPQMGEGSYEGSREYGESMKAYLETADVKADAQAAQPDSPEQAAELKKAEQDGLSHSKAPGQ